MQVVYGMGVAPGKMGTADDHDQKAALQVENKEDSHD
jgi:hypothetical protein